MSATSVPHVITSSHASEADFRLAMRRLAATVSIVTCKDSSTPYGITATAVTSVCAEPPTILVCINSETRLYAKMAQQRRFCVNLLKACHADLSQRFGRKNSSQNRFALGDWADSDNHIYLRDAQANLFCSMQQVVDVASHGIFVAQVDRIHVATEIEPLSTRTGNMPRRKR